MPARRQSTQASFDPRSVQEHIVETPLKEEMSSSFLEYAYSVIYARALPDARDGMKPVQRRIIYQMGQMHLGPTRPHMKSARVTGEVMGKLHPHGDSAIYEAMVRLAQPFAMRLPLVDGHGNFGSLDDGPAASRYTEARLAHAATAMNADIEEDTVDFVPNYDNRLKEPEVLPAAIPNLLVNGAAGIAVGMATNMATHNLGEVVRAAQHLMQHPDASVEELMRYIPGPDWPQGGIIVGRDGIREAYETGRGTLTTQATTHIEHITPRKKAIIVTELPFMVGPERVLERLSEGIRNHKLEGISAAMDLSDRHHGTRLVIEVKSGFDPQAVLAQCLKYTPLQENFTINNVALVDGRPQTLGLKALLEVWIAHRRRVVQRRSLFRKRQAQERLHLVNGLLTALLDIDEVIQVIRTSQDAQEAIQRLITVFDLDEIQAQHILELRLRRLTKLSRLELQAEQDELNERIAQLEHILCAAAHLDEVVIAEMQQVVHDYGTARRTLLLDTQPDGSLVAVATNTTGQEQEHSQAADKSTQQALQHTAALMSAQQDLRAAQQSQSTTSALQLEDTPCSVLLTTQGRMVRTPYVLEQQSHHTNTGQSHETIEHLEQDTSAHHASAQQHEATHQYPVRYLLNTTTLSNIGLVTNTGRLVVIHTSDLPVCDLAQERLADQGVAANDLIMHTEHTDYAEYEQVIALVRLGEQATVPLAMATRHGVIKRWNLESPTTMDSWSIIDLKERDELIGVYEAHDEDRLVLLSSDASLLTYAADQVRPQGRNAAGMAGIRLDEHCHVVAFAVVPQAQVAWNYEEHEDGLFHASGAVVVTIAGNSEGLMRLQSGSAKVTPLSMYPTKGRATGGVRSHRFLKGQNTITQAYIGAYPVMGYNDYDEPIMLPKPDMRRDGSGVALDQLVSVLTSPIRG